MSKIVTAPLVLARDKGDHVRYLYQGAVVPEDIQESEVTRLGELGFIADDGSDAVAGLIPGAIGVTPVVLTTEPVADQPAMDEPVKADEKPARATSRR